MKRLMLMIVAITLCADLALAEGTESSCETECPSGQVRVGYADGNGSSCQCVAQADMQEPEIPEAGEPEEGHS